MWKNGRRYLHTISIGDTFHFEADSPEELTKMYADQMQKTDPVFRLDSKRLSF